MTWRSEFGQAWGVPIEIDRLVASGELADLSWRTDAVVPAFGVFAEPGSGVVAARLYVDHVEPAERETGARFAVTVGDPDDDAAVVLYAGANVATAVTAYRAVAHLLDPRRPMRKAPRGARVGSPAVFDGVALPLDLAIALQERGPQPALAIPGTTPRGAGFLVALPLWALEVLGRDAVLVPPFVTPSHVVAALPRRLANPRPAPHYPAFAARAVPPGGRPAGDPRPRLVAVSKEAAAAFVAAHHSKLPYVNPRGLLYTLGVEVAGRLVAVATVNTPSGRYSGARCAVDGVVELSRVASDGTALGASSMLAARALDLLPVSGRRGVPGCLFVTYSLLSESGTTYLALADKGLRPVALQRGRRPGGARRTSGDRALPGEAKIAWEAGPAALPPDWSVLAGRVPAARLEGARRAFAAWEAREAAQRARALRRSA